MTDQELERRLRDWYRTEIPSDQVAPAMLRSRVEAIPRGLSEPRRGFRSRRGFILLAAAALVGLLAGSAVIGGRFQTPPVPSVVPSPLPAVFPSERPPNEPSISPVAGRIVYTRWKTIRRGEEDCTTATRFCHRASTFISNQDGSDERELFPGQYSHVLAASLDGSKLIVSIRESAGAHVYLADVDGSAPRLLDTNCQLPCFGDAGFSFSPDGTRIAFVRGVAREPAHPGEQKQMESAIAIQDVLTGTVAVLDSTNASNPIGDPGPSWSPDGEHVLFSRVGIGIPNKPQIFEGSALFVVDADGTNFHQLVSIELHARGGQWSPDGSLIVFTSVIETLAKNPDTGVVDNVQQANDIYVVRPNGSDVHRLTTDSEAPVGTTDPVEYGARFPSWTRDGRIVFTRGRFETEWQLWVMDSDGGNATRLDPSDAAALTAIGCVSCPYSAFYPSDMAYPSLAFWLPAR